MGRELEWKYRADKETLSAIRERFGPFASITMETAYYDTPDRALSRRRWTLRRRLENGVPVCTLKTPGENGSRGEWEVQRNSLSDAIPELCQLGAPGELAELTRAGITEVCAARFTRLAATLRSAECTLELALDRGCLTGGGRELPFAEVEVEYKSGSEAAAEAFARTLSADFSLVPEPKSKAQRAMALADTP